MIVIGPFEKLSVRKDTNIMAIGIDQRLALLSMSVYNALAYTTRCSHLYIKVRSGDV